MISVLIISALGHVYIIKLPEIQINLVPGTSRYSKWQTSTGRPTFWISRRSWGRDWIQSYGTSPNEAFCIKDNWPKIQQHVALITRCWSAVSHTSFPLELILIQIFLITTRKKFVPANDSWKKATTNLNWGFDCEVLTTTMFNKI